MEIAAISPDKHTDTSNPSSRMAVSFPRKAVACLSLLLIASAWTSAAHADCRNYGAESYPQQVSIKNFPASFTLKKANIGEIIATHTEYFYSETGSAPYWNCGPDDWYRMTPPKITLLASHLPQVYETGIPGVGIRIKFSTRINPRYYNLPPPINQSISQGGGGSLYPPQFVTIDFIRTAMGVGKGDFTFSYETEFSVQTKFPTAGSWHKIVGTSLRTTLKQDVYFTSCHTPRTVTDVNMGRAVVAEIKLGQAKEHAFSLDVQCEGMNPATKPPVKVYFEGNAVRDGLLNLDGGGAANVAKGVGIAVTNDKGKDVPFTKGGALPLTWQSSGTNLERYRFSGKARYVATTGEMTAGKADATLTYVLQYE